MPVDVERVEIAAHPHDTEAHSRLWPRHHGRCVAQVLAAIDAHARVAQRVEELQVQRLDRRNAVVPVTQAGELRKPLVELENEIAALNHALDQRRPDLRFVLRVRRRLIGSRRRDAFMRHVRLQGLLQDAQPVEIVRQHVGIEAARNREAHQMPR